MERGHLEDIHIEGEIIFKRIFRNVDAETCIRLIWFRIWTSGVPL
jgi:hypothetical protein